MPQPRTQQVSQNTMSLGTQHSRLVMLAPQVHLTPLEGQTMTTASQQLGPSAWPMRMWQL
jgi:hypothetical protein